MKLRDLDRAALALPGATVQIQWGDDRVYKVGGKMFAATANGKPTVQARVSFKCSDLAFAMLTERPGIIPARYLARAKWVTLDAPEAMDDAEVAARLAEAHRLVAEKLPRKTQAELGLAPPPRAKAGASRAKRQPRA